jgi:hypothetical protein
VFEFEADKAHVQFIEKAECEKPCRADMLEPA